jgi:hypothetical protein
MAGWISGLGRWIAWGAVVGVVVVVLRTDFAPWSAAGLAFNLASLAGGAIGGLFLASVILALRRWAGRRPAVKF